MKARSSAGIGKEWRLCVILGGEPDPVAAAREVLEAGVRVLQYRGEEKPGALQYREAAALREETRRCGAVLIINDRSDIALQVQAEGVHVGAEDLPVPATRRLLGSGRILGVTAHGLDEARRAEQEGADYIGFGAVFASTSKPEVPVAGLEALARIRASVSIPVIAIGGISPERVPAVLGAGAAGVAVMSGISAARDRGAAAREFLERTTA